MRNFEVELSLKGVRATEIEDASGNHFDNSEDDFEMHRLERTDNLDAESLTKFVKDKLEVIWDGTLDNPEHFKSLEIIKVEGPMFASYDGGLNLSDISILLNVEVMHDDPDDIDFDDLFHALVFRLSSGGITITLTEFESYYAQVMSV